MAGNTEDKNGEGRGTKKGDLSVSLRREIIAGGYKPGEKLPTQIELQKRLKVSGTTVQAALATLTRDGFIEAKTNWGTRVVPHPPHLCRYGWVFPLAADDPAWSHHQFYAAVRKTAELLHRPPTRRVRMFFGVASHVESDAYRRLAAELAAERLAGVVYHDPYHLRLTPLAGLLDHPDVPMVGIMGGHWSPPAPGLMGVTMQRVVVERALDWFRERGRKRVAALCLSSDSDALIHRFEAAAAEREMTTYPYWIHGGDPDHRWWVRHVIHLMMNSGQTERPDALLITDDNLVEEATLGLMVAGVRVPQDLEIVAHANFPYPTRSLCPAKRIGYDARQVASACLELINQRRHGETPPAMTEMPALFDHELTDPGAVTVADVARQG